jgi:hypothetical protein
MTPITNLADKTIPVLCLTDIHRANAGLYSLIASNSVDIFTNNFQLHVVVPQQLSASVESASHMMTVAFS